MTGSYLLISAVFFSFLVAGAISIFLTYRKTNKVLEDNNMLAGEVETLKGETVEHQKALDELKEQLLMKREVAEMREETESLRENIRDTKDMTDEELRAWVDRQISESRIFTNPELTLKMISQQLGLTQKKLKQLLKDSERYDRLYDYLTEKRVLYSCELIKENPQWSIDAVSKDAGFVSRTTFQTEFKKRIGVTPAQYRQNSQNEVVRIK